MEDTYQNDTPELIISANNEMSSWRSNWLSSPCKDKLASFVNHLGLPLVDGHEGHYTSMLVLAQRPVL